MGQTDTAEPAAAEVARRLEQIARHVDGDAVLVRRGRFLDADILIGIGGGPSRVERILSIREGRVAALEDASRLMRPWVFAVRAQAADWLAHWEDPPRPGWHDLLAMSKRGAVTIEGNLAPFMQNLQYVKDVLAAPRRAP
jgi:hypothetical protein